MTQATTPATHLSSAELAKTFVIESIDLGDLSGLVVTAEEADARRETGLEKHHKSGTLHLHHV